MILNLGQFGGCRIFSFLMCFIFIHFIIYYSIVLFSSLSYFLRVILVSELAKKLNNLTT